MKDIIEVIATESPLFIDSIHSNLTEEKDISTIYISDNIKNCINSYSKIDLLIFASSGLDKLDSLHHVKTIVNLTNKSCRDDEILLTLPCKLLDLLDIIYNNRTRSQIFCNINQQWIYDEQRSMLFDKTVKIKFTEKENEVFKHLCRASNNIMYKSELLSMIWHYNRDSDSNTIETHLWRLKQKLPHNMLQIYNDYYTLLKS